MRVKKLFHFEITRAEIYERNYKLDDRVYVDKIVFVCGKGSKREMIGCRIK